MSRLLISGPLPRLEGVVLLERLAQRRGLTCAQMALAWVLQQPGVCSVLVGASVPDQLVENAAASGVRLGSRTLELVDKIFAGCVNDDVLATAEAGEGDAVRKDVRHDSRYRTPSAASHLDRGFRGIPCHARRPEVTEFIGKHDAESAAKRLREAEEGWAESGYGMFAVLDRRTGEFLGRCGLVYWPEFDETEIGWALRRDAWGRGYATEAARACVDWTLANTPLTRLTAMINPANPRSRAVAERLGMTWSRSTEFKSAIVDVYELGEPKPAAG